MSTPGKGITAYPLIPQIVPKNAADYTVKWSNGDETRTIASCMPHIPATMSELGSIFVEIDKVNPMDHTCMGCLKGWAKSNDNS